MGGPALTAGEVGTLPFAVGCGFAGGGLRELCPKEEIWRLSPLFFADLPKHTWRVVSRFRVDWHVLLAAAPVGLEALRLLIGFRFGPVGIFFLRPDTVWIAGLILLSTVLSVAIPIKIWNSARIEHRLQEQDKLLMAERVETLTRQINPHFLFNTLTSISSLIRSQPETARMLIIRLSAMLRGCSGPASTTSRCARSSPPSTSTSTSRRSGSDRRLPSRRRSARRRST